MPIVASGDLWLLGEWKITDDFVTSCWGLHSSRFTYLLIYLFIIKLIRLSFFKQLTFCKLMLNQHFNFFNTDVESSV